MLMYPMWAHMLCLFKMRKLRLTAVKSVTQCTEGSGRRVSVNSSPPCPKAAAEYWSVPRVERERWGSWKMGKLLWKLCRKGDAESDRDNLTLVGRCRGGNTGQEDRSKYSRGPSVNATVSGLNGRATFLSCLELCLLQGTSHPSILPVFEVRGGGGEAVQHRAFLH